MFYSLQKCFVKKEKSLSTSVQIKFDTLFCNRTKFKKYFHDQIVIDLHIDSISCFVLTQSCKQNERKDQLEVALFIVLQNCYFFDKALSVHWSISKPGLKTRNRKGQILITIYKKKKEKKRILDSQSLEELCAKM